MDVDYLKGKTITNAFYTEKMDVLTIHLDNGWIFGVAVDPDDRMKLCDTGKLISFKDHVERWGDRVDSLA